MPATAAPTFLQVSDGTQLEVEVRHAAAPPSSSEQQHSSHVVAVLLHPWGPLGGQCRDPVVAAVFRRLLKIHGGAPTTTVARFNARGVGLSESFPARTSLLAQAAGTLALTPSQRNEREAGDLVDVVAHALAEAAKAAAAVDQHPHRRRRLWLMGYSHGSLVASRALPILRERLPLIDPDAELAGVVAIAPPLGLICSVFLGASAAFGPFAAGGGNENSSLARLALLGTRDNFTSVAQLRAALQGFEFERHQRQQQQESDDGGEARRRGRRPHPARALLLDEADHFFFGRAGEVAEAAVAFVAEVEEEEARRRDVQGG